MWEGWTSTAVLPLRYSLLADAARDSEGSGRGCPIGLESASTLVRSSEERGFGWKVCSDGGGRDRPQAACPPDRRHGRRRSRRL